MSNYIKFEMMNLLNKKNMSILFLFTLIIFCSCILMQKKNEEAYRNQLDDIKIMEQNEQYHINILKYDLEENNNVKNKQELDYWNKEIEYTLSLQDALKEKNNLKILKVRIERNKHILKGMNNHYISAYTDYLSFDKKKLKKDIVLDEYNLKNNQLDIVDQSKPTLCFYLKKIQSISVFSFSIIILIIVINSTSWSKEFSKSKFYQHIFSCPMGRKEILQIRNRIYTIYTMILVFFFTLAICIFGYIQNGFGGNQSVISNGSFQNIFKVLFSDYWLFFFCVVIYAQMSQFLSLIIKDELVTSFAMIIILLLSSYVMHYWNLFSFFMSYNTSYLLIKIIILFFFSRLVSILCASYIENIDLE